MVRHLQNLLGRFRVLLERRPPATIVRGVVYPPGPGAGRSRGEKKWSYGFSLCPWRVDGSEIRGSALRVHKAVSDDELKHLRGVLESYAVVALRVRFDAADLGRASL